MTVPEVSGTAARPRAQTRPRVRASAHIRRRRRLGWLFLLPLLATNGLVVFAPSLANLYYAFTDWSGVGEATWIGLENFERMLADPEFRSGLWHNVQWTALFLTVPIGLGLVGAFLLSQIRRFQLTFRIIYFIPFVMASTVNAAIWQNLLDPDQGAGAELDRAGIGLLAGVSFFGDPDLALISVAFVDNWHFWGFLVLLFLAAMQSVDPELYDAARVDGAGLWRQFWHVTLPGIRPTLVFAMVLVTIWSFLTFDYVYIITQGGPAGATETAATVLYKTVFEYGEAGYAAAMGVGLSAITIVLLLGYGLLRRLGWQI
ncbi:MAG TPA: sugar ABC transporter permease [Solirubrobacter sp.]|nr:sugar ABC transporter permease [Solirubrobacter sp.]